MRCILEPLLKLPQGRVLKKHHGKSTHQAVVKIVLRIGSAVGALNKPLGEFFSKAGKADVLFDMQAATPISSVLESGGYHM